MAVAIDNLLAADKAIATEALIAGIRAPFFSAGDIEAI